MKSSRTIGLFLLLMVPILAAEKHRFDVSADPALRRAPFGSDVLTRTGIEDGVLSATLLSGGYFTLGTTGGVSETIFDDHCALSYGHTYAMTSFPVIAIDGIWTVMQAVSPLSAPPQGRPLVLLTMIFPRYRQRAIVDPYVLPGWR